MFIITIFAKNFEIPKFLIYTSTNLGATLVPIAMIAIGMKLELKHIFTKYCNSCSCFKNAYYSNYCFICI